jgi:nicotinamidase-related amidase
MKITRKVKKNIISKIKNNLIKLVKECDKKNIKVQFTRNSYSNNQITVSFYYDNKILYKTYPDIEDIIKNTFVEEFTSLAIRNYNSKLTTKSIKAK